MFTAIEKLFIGNGFTKVEADESSEGYFYKVVTARANCPEDERDQLQLNYNEDMCQFQVGLHSTVSGEYTFIAGGTPGHVLAAATRYICENQLIVWG